MADSNKQKLYVSDTGETTFQYDKDLPSLPVPNLNDTLERYLDSVRPHLTTEEFEKTSLLVSTFGTGVGRQLNSLLLERASTSRNWPSLADQSGSNGYVAITRGQSESNNSVAEAGSQLLALPASELKSEDKSVPSVLFVKSEPTTNDKEFVCASQLFEIGEEKVNLNGDSDVQIESVSSPKVGGEEFKSQPESKPGPSRKRKMLPDSEVVSDSELEESAELDPVSDGELSAADEAEQDCWEIVDEADSDPETASAIPSPKRTEARLLRPEIVKNPKIILPIHLYHNHQVMGDTHGVRLVEYCVRDAVSTKVDGIRRLGSAVYDATLAELIFIVKNNILFHPHMLIIAGTRDLLDGREVNDIVQAFKTLVFALLWVDDVRHVCIMGIPLTPLLKQLNDGSKGLLYRRAKAVNMRLKQLVTKLPPNVHFHAIDQQFMVEMHFEKSPGNWIVVPYPNFAFFEGKPDLQNFNDKGMDLLDDTLAKAFEQCSSRYGEG